MRIYPIKIKNDQGIMESRAGIDSEDLYTFMLELETTNFNLLENWYIVRTRVIEAGAILPEEKTENDLLPPLPPPPAAPGPEVKTQAFEKVDF